MVREQGGGGYCKAREMEGGGAKEKVRERDAVVGKMGERDTVERRDEGERHSGRSVATCILAFPNAVLASRPYPKSTPINLRYI
jgi:hypothetical protein